MNIAVLLSQIIVSPSQKFNLFLDNQLNIKNVRFNIYIKNITIF